MRRYETFEQDPIKYKQYQAAVRAALIDRHPVDGPTPVVMVLGAGRGPLVQASLDAAVEAQRTIRVWAVDKNANAVVTLQNRCLNEPSWAAHVTVVPGDMRAIWADGAPEVADIIVSELLGSWGDNELSPECLDGAMRYLRPGGISIPASYVSTVAPLSSSKLWNEVCTRMHVHARTAHSRWGAYPWRCTSLCLLRRLYAPVHAHLHTRCT